MKDEEAYANYLNGEDDGLNELMERYGNSLTFYINGYIHNVHDAEDIMIDVFSYLITKKPRIQDGCLKSYLYKSARHMALRKGTKNRRNRCFSFDELEQEPESEILVEEVVYTEERKRILHFCMEQLNANYREALYLVYFEGMHHCEAAAVMKKSEKQIADLIYRGKLSLKKRLELEGITNEEY